jgi:hypothetical protein
VLAHVDTENLASKAAFLRHLRQQLSNVMEQVLAGKADVLSDKADALLADSHLLLTRLLPQYRAVPKLDGKGQCAGKDTTEWSAWIDRHRDLLLYFCRGVVRALTTVFVRILQVSRVALAACRLGPTLRRPAWSTLRDAVPQGCTTDGPGEDIDRTTRSCPQLTIFALLDTAKSRGRSLNSTARALLPCINSMHIIFTLVVQCGFVRGLCTGRECTSTSMAAALR